jgi:hypothetical protein
MNNSRKRNKKGESFAGIPRAVMDNPDYKSLSGNGVKLLVELAYQYRGHNNGDLATAFRVLKTRGWRSRQTIDRAKIELLKHELILQTREGRFLNPGGRCALYALAWASIDECPGKDLEVKPTRTAARTFKRNGSGNSRVPLSDSSVGGQL